MSLRCNKSLACNNDQRFGSFYEGWGSENTDESDTNRTVAFEKHISWPRPCTLVKRVAVCERLGTRLAQCSSREEPLMAVRVLIADSSGITRDIIRSHLECGGCQVVGRNRDRRADNRPRSNDASRCDHARHRAAQCPSCRRVVVVQDDSPGVAGDIDRGRWRRRAIIGQPANLSAQRRAPICR